MTMTSKPAFALISGAANIKAAIDSIERRGKKYDHDVQIAAHLSVFNRSTPVSGAR